MFEIEVPDAWLQIDEDELRIKKMWKIEAERQKQCLDIDYKKSLNLYHSTCVPQNINIRQLASRYIKVPRMYGSLYKTMENQCKFFDDILLDRLYSLSSHNPDDVSKKLNQLETSIEKYWINI